MTFTTSIHQALGNSRAFTSESAKPNGTSFYHRGSKIAELGEKGLWISLAGFDTDPTTDSAMQLLHERLNRLLSPYGVKVGAKECRSVLYLSCDSEIRMDPNEWYFLNDSRKGTRR